MKQTFAIGIGGAAGQGVATPGDIFAKIFSRRGLHLNADNAYQSIIRGGPTFLTIRTGPATLDLKSLPASPLMTTTGADQSNLQLAIGSTTLTSGISVFNSASGFASAVNSDFAAGTNKISRLVAYGQYDSVNNTFVAARISVALHE